MRISSSFNFKELEKPFLLGWKREIVERLNSTKKCSDTYYISPAGKKLRSVPEVLKYLLSINDVSGLSSINFNFSGHLVYHEPEEYYRGKFNLTNRSNNLLNLSHTKDETMETNPIKTVEKKTIDIPPPSQESKKIFKKRLANTKTKLSCKNKGLRIIISKTVPAKRKYIKRKEIESKGIKLESYKIDEPKSIINESHANFKFSRLKRKYIAESNEVARDTIDRTDLCSLSCHNLEGVLPSLNCDFCMCSFHPECVDAIGVSSNFTCRLCREHQTGSITAATTTPSILKKKRSNAPVIILPKPKKSYPMKEVLPNTSSSTNETKTTNNLIHQVGSPGRILSIPVNMLQQRLDLTRNLNISIDGNRYTIAPKFVIESSQTMQIFIPT